MVSSKSRRRQPRSAVRRVWLYCLLLSLPSLVLGALYFEHLHLGRAATLLAVCCLLLYLLLLAAALIEDIVRPIQTLSNVISSLREGDYSFRARGASTRDAFGELATEVNALADLLRRQRVRSLEATALLARILEVMHTPLFAFDRDNLLQLVNDSGLRLLALPHARCFGRSAHELGLEALLAAPDQSIHTIASHNSFSASSRWLLRKTAFRQEGVPHTLLILDDVSLPLQDEERSAWKRLIRVLGHEISNSLAPIKSIAGSLRMRVDSLTTEEDVLHDFRRGLNVVESRADSLHRFVQSYRRLAQLPPPTLRPVALGALVERIVLLEQRLAVTLDSGPDAELMADPDQLEQMFINLLTNAVDASLEASSKTSAEPVRVAWSLHGPNVTVEIDDRGLGIANPDNLFVPFYTTKPKGSGVGLVLAQQIARAHGGDIQLANREDGTGVRATVRLPLA